MLHRRIAPFLAACLIASSTGAPVRADNGRPTDEQIQRFLIDIPTSQGILDDLTRLNQQAHYPGTYADREIAFWMRDQLRSYGFDATVEPLTATVPQLKRAVLELLVHPKVDMDLKEASIPQDPDGSRTDAGMPFNAFSGSGDVTAPVVYVNRGREADYKTLAGAGVSVDGNIVLVRYGAEFRGELARRAQQHHAAGVLFYSDPAGNDNKADGPPYPNGPYRPMGSVQRGSLAAPHLDIPVFPITAINAARLLQEMDGKYPPKEWIGGLNVEYALGATRVPVHFRVDESYSTVNLWNTVGVLPGEDLSHSIVIGAHRDAWVYGVTDDGSGISTILETAHALGYAYHAGWRPHASIVVAGWDGEEVGEVGSAEYVRSHFYRLVRGGIAYINADENATGSFFTSNGVAALSGLVSSVARMVPDPHERTRSVWAKWRAQAGGVTTGPPGGGSDHEAFLYTAGVPVVSMAFNGPFGVYHSAYDDLQYASTQADPHFVYHRALSQMMALLAFRLTESPLPYDLGAYVHPMRDAYVQFAASNGTGADITPLSHAIDRFEAREVAWAQEAHDGGGELDAVHQLNLLFYGRSGYAPVAFPTLSAAMAAGNAAAVQKAVDDTAGTLDGITGGLR